jgi:transcriptional regulator with GAF, ATPase, and Fis domain
MRTFQGRLALVSDSPSPTTTLGMSQASPGGRHRVRQIRVVFAPRPLAQPVVTLGPADLAVGRAPAAAAPLTVPDQAMSRLHAVIRWDAGSQRHVVEDPGSRNGTYVDGERITRAHLSAGAVIRVGNTLLVYADCVVPEGADLLEESDGLLGASMPIRLLRAEIARVAPRALPVLILGESGVGKERVAEAIHARSGRSGRFLPVNCGALPEGLAESELFGHVAGAFTGAAARREGIVSAAHGGTLFLDEVGEMPPSVQAKLLRALATGEIRPVGSSEVLRVDVRIIAATLRDLDSEVAAGGFRGDLFSRLAAWQITVAPLRQRREDVLPLAMEFLRRHSKELSLAVDAAEALLLHAWPYNVRELEQEMAAAAVRADQGLVIRLAHLPERIAGRLGARAAPSIAEDPPLVVAVPRDQTPTREALLRVLEHFEWNVSRAADYFKKNRRQIYRWAERFELELERKQP